jgi:lipopolysaccharide transport system ATP-binding protein
MTPPIIEAQGISKRYRLGAIGATTLRESFSRWWQDRLHAGSGVDKKEFWALNDVSFNVKAGEVVGFIGRNGAGKSTLLKILSRITNPTSGRVVMRGRVASLLEIGTGFHPDLTGKENIYLNGAILGMKRAEIRQRFDEIVAFAEVEQFINTPVKRYSSGMYVRLAFAVAAHLDPEILIVDEVLAVGDLQFQKKCLARMQSVSRQDGRTVLFVSHSIDSILRLCGKVVWLEKGRLKAHGPTAEVIQAYAQTRRTLDRAVNLGSAPRDDRLRQAAKFQNLTSPADLIAPWTFGFGQPIRFTGVITADRPVQELVMAYAIFNSSGLELASNRMPINGMDFDRHRHELTIEIPHLRLTPGSYSMNLGLSSQSGEEDFISEAVNFEVDTNEEAARLFADRIKASCIPESSIQVRRIDAPPL